MARLARDELLNPLSIQVVPTTNNASVEHSSVEKIHIYKDDEHHRDVDLFFNSRASPLHQGIRSPEFRKIRCPRKRPTS